MSSQYDQPQQPSKWRQYIGPIIILVLAVGLAIYGLVWASNDENALPTEETTTEDAAQPEQSDASAHLEQVQQEYPDASPEDQEALAAARALAETYIISEHLLQEELTNPEYGYEFSQEAAAFAVENIEVDWNEQAYHFASLAREEYPEATDAEIENLLRDEPGGPQFTAEQTEYAMSQLN